MKVLLINDALAFFDGKNFVYADIRNFVDVSPRPTNLDQIYLRSLLEPEMKSQITLRKITTTTVDFLDLR